MKFFPVISTREAIPYITVKNKWVSPTKNVELHLHSGDDLSPDLVAHFYGWVTPTPFVAVYVCLYYTGINMSVAFCRVIASHNSLNYKRL